MDNNIKELRDNEDGFPCRVEVTETLVPLTEEEVARGNDKYAELNGDYDDLIEKRTEFEKETNEKLKIIEEALTQFPESFKKVQEVVVEEPTENQEQY